jgi:hypothetical protein
VVTAPRADADARELRTTRFVFRGNSEISERIGGNRRRPCALSANWRSQVSDWSWPFGEVREGPLPSKTTGSNSRPERRRAGTELGRSSSNGKMRRLRGWRGYQTFDACGGSRSGGELDAALEEGVRALGDLVSQGIECARPSPIRLRSGRHEAKRGC